MADKKADTVVVPYGFKKSLSGLKKHISDNGAMNDVTDQEITVRVAQNLGMEDEATWLATPTHHKSWVQGVESGFADAPAPTNTPEPSTTTTTSQPTTSGGGGPTTTPPTTTTTGGKTTTTTPTTTTGGTSKP